MVSHVPTQNCPCSSSDHAQTHSALAAVVHNQIRRRGYRTAQEAEQSARAVRPQAHHSGYTGSTGPMRTGSGSVPGELACIGTEAEGEIGAGE